MLAEGSPIYLGSEDSPSDRSLQLGIIAAMARDRWTIDFETSDRHFDIGDEPLIYYRQIDKFFQRRVKIEEQSENGPVLRMVMKLIADAPFRWHTIKSTASHHRRSNAL